MAQFDFHKNDSSNPPPNQFSLSIVSKLTRIYKIWHEYLPDFPKDSKYTLGAKIDSLLLETIEETIISGSSDKTEKLISLKKASAKLDLLKFFLQIAWEMKILDNKKYINLSEGLNEIGKMIGGWIKAIK